MGWPCSDLLGDEVCDVGVGTRRLGVSLAFSARQRLSSIAYSFQLGTVSRPSVFKGLCRGLTD